MSPTYVNCLETAYCGHAGGRHTHRGVTVRPFFSRLSKNFFVTPTPFARASSIADSIHNSEARRKAIRMQSSQDATFAAAEGALARSHNEVEDIAARIGLTKLAGTNTNMLYGLSPTADLEKTPSPLLPVPRVSHSIIVPQLPDFKPFRDTQLWTGGDLGMALHLGSSTYVWRSYPRVHDVLRHRSVYILVSRGWRLGEVGEGVARE